MVKYTGKDGKEYVLRYDMYAMEEIKEKYQGTAEALQQMSGRAIDVVVDVFVILAQAGAEFVAERDGRICKEKITGEGLLTKRSSPGRVAGMMAAIKEAVKDGNRMQTKDEEDDTVRDGYLEELREQEREKGKN